MAAASIGRARLVRLGGRKGTGTGFPGGSKKLIPDANYPIALQIRAAARGLREMLSLLRGEGGFCS